MKAIELRIGNLIQDEAGFIDIVESLNGFGGDEINEDSATGRYEPIPLTKEWMVKFGVTPQPTVFEDYEVDYFFIKEANLTIGISSKGTIDAEFNDVLIKEPIYVHQLQNLYHALTGEELTFKD